VQIFNKFAAMQEAETGVARGMLEAGEKRAQGQGEFFRTHSAADNAKPAK
jgi:hypothetical protein